MNALDPIYLVLAAASSPWWARKTRRGWRHRLAIDVPEDQFQDDRPRVLLHAVSVGEVNALRTLVPMLLEHARVIVATTTDTGLERARALFADRCLVVRYPLDFSTSVGRFLDAIKPDVVGLIELELWPNFLGVCKKREIPVCVINGRLSARSFRGYSRFRPFVSRMFGSLQIAGVQDESYAERFVSLGLPADRCVVTGSMKWDAVAMVDQVPGADELREQMGIDPDRPLIVAGSTGPGEEQLFHDACPPGVQLLCAPRKPERFGEAAQALPGCKRRTQQNVGVQGTDRFLLDTIGELAVAYALADVVIVGRSFNHQFGSDPIEPIALGKPVVVGPAVADFAIIVQALTECGGLIQSTTDNLKATLGKLCTDFEWASDVITKGRACICKHQGASQLHARLLLALAGGNEHEIKKLMHDPADASCSGARFMSQ